MHELALTTDMLEAIEERMIEHPGRKVTRVVLEIGELMAVLPDSMRFCFGLCAEGTVAQGAALEIVEISGKARCRSCGGCVDSTVPYAVCACGSAELDWVTGQELKVRSLEIE